MMTGLQSVDKEKADVGLSVWDAATVQNGDIFVLAIRMWPNGQEVDAADVRLTFDRNYLRVVDASGNETASIIADPNDVFNNVLRNIADNSAGTIRYAAGPDFTQSPPTTNFRLANIRFKAIQVTTGTLIQLGTCTIARSGIPYGLTKSNGSVVIQGIASLPVRQVIHVTLLNGKLEKVEVTTE